KAVDRGDQGQQAAGDEVVQLAVGRQLAHLAAGQVLDHRSVGEDEPVAGGDVAAVAPGPPQRLGALGGGPAGGRGRCFPLGASSSVVGGGGLGHRGTYLS